MKDGEPIFADSNIWLYALIDNGDGSKQAIARQFLAQPNIHASTQVINEVCRNMIRKAKWDHGQIARLIDSFYANYPVQTFSNALLQHAVQLRQAYSLSFWDSLIVTSALSSGATVLASEDMQSGLVITNTLTIVNPFVD